LKITADTNLLVRAVTLDDPGQARMATETLAKADLLALTMPALCEFAWVMRSGYNIPRAGIAAAIRGMLAAKNVVTNAPAVAAGLATLDAGGDFADGVIAYEGRRLGGDEFVSFDRRAVALARAQGAKARLLA
jgi:predicted nucleic-acid-binding protein